MDPRRFGCSLIAACPSRIARRRTMLAKSCSSKQPMEWPFLDTPGLERQIRGTEPADWMSAVLRGRNLPLEQSLAVLAEAMKSQFPSHMFRMRGDGGPAHSVIVPAFLGTEPKVYTIDLAFARDRKSYAFRYTRHVHSLATPRTPRMAIYGSGALYLAQDKSWIRSLFRVVRANDRGRVSPLAVADHMASLILKFIAEPATNQLGHAASLPGGTGRGAFITAGEDSSSIPARLNASSSPLPTTAHGKDIQALLGMMMPRWIKNFEAIRSGKSPVEENKDEINSELARLPDKPDENLR